MLSMLHEVPSSEKYVRLLLHEKTSKTDSHYGRSSLTPYILSVYLFIHWNDFYFH